MLGRRELLEPSIEDELVVLCQLGTSRLSQRLVATGICCRFSWVTAVVFLGRSGGVDDDEDDEDDDEEDNEEEDEYELHEDR
jgi:hypothetical protein